MKNFAILRTLQLGLSCHSITIDLIPSSNHTVKSLFLVFEKQVFPDRIVTWGVRALKIVGVDAGWETWYQRNVSHVTKRIDMAPRAHHYNCGLPSAYFDLRRGQRNPSQHLHSTYIGQSFEPFAKESPWWTCGSSCYLLERRRWRSSVSQRWSKEAAVLPDHGGWAFRKKEGYKGGMKGWGMAEDQSQSLCQLVSPSKFT